MLFLSDRIFSIDTSEIRRAFDMVAKVEDPKNLSIGQPDFPVPYPVKEAFIKAIRDDLNAYSPTQGILPLREALSEYYSKKMITIQPEGIVVSTGVASILFLLFQVLFNKGDHILMTDPYFLIYHSLAEYHGLQIHYISENFNQESIDLWLKKTRVKKVKAIIFASPSNPTGKILSEEQLKILASLADKLDALLISDEIYSFFDYDSKFTHTAIFNPEKTLTLGGFSKSHAMTGLRVGFIGVPRELQVIADKVATLQQYSIVCSPQPAQWAAIEALKTPMDAELELMRKRREIVLTILGEKVVFTAPEGAFYVFPEVPIDGSDFVEKAARKKLLLVPGSIFSRNQKTVRISYAQKEDILREGLNIFCQLLEETEYAQKENY